VIVEGSTLNQSISSGRSSTLCTTVFEAGALSSFEASIVSASVANAHGTWSDIINAKYMLERFIVTSLYVAALWLARSNSTAKPSVRTFQN